MIISQGSRISSQGEYPLYQDNKSAMLLETNGCKSAGKCSHHLSIQYFYVTDQKAKGHIDIKYCPTDKMIGDYMTKPPHGVKFELPSADNASASYSPINDGCSAKLA